MSRKSQEKDRQKRMATERVGQRWWGWIVLVMVAVIVLGVWQYASPKSHWYGNEEDLTSRFDHILSHVPQKQVHPFLRPVHLMIGDQLVCSGTLVLKKNGSPSHILTVSHLFSEVQPGSDYYDYNVLSPNGYVEKGHVSSVTVDEFRSEHDPGVICDLATCQIGEPKLIARNSKVRASGGQSGLYEVNMVTRLDRPIMLTLLSTGEKFPLIGQMTTPTTAFWVVQYDPLPGESGSGLWGSDSNLYVIGRSAPIDSKLRKLLKIPKEYTGKRLALVSGTHTEW